MQDLCTGLNLSLIHIVSLSLAETEFLIFVLCRVNIFEVVAIAGYILYQYPLEDYPEL